MRPYRLIIFLALLVAVGAVAAACGGKVDDTASTSKTKTVEAPKADSTVNVKIGEMYMAPDVSSVPAGNIRFNVTNGGKEAHEMVALKTNVPYDALPVTNARVDESSSAGEVADIAAGATKSGTINLKPGKYVLVCNIPGHYAMGMYTEFEVTAKTAADTTTGTTSAEENTATDNKLVTGAELKVDTTVTATLSDMKVTLDKTTVPAGNVRFDVTNSGTIMHELVLLKTNLPAGKLPTLNGRVDEATSVGEVADIEAKATESGAFTLKPGKYALICNIPGHYPAGMWVQFTVT